MKRYLIFTAALLLFIWVVTLFTSQQPNIAGTYENRTSSLIQLTLNEDGTFTYREKAGTSTVSIQGTYHFDPETKEVNLIYEDYHEMDWDRLVRYRKVARFKNSECTELAMEGLLYFKK